MPEYTVTQETTIVKTSTVTVQAPSAAEAIKLAELRLKTGDVDWGIAEIGQKTIDIAEIGEKMP